MPCSQVSSVHVLCIDLVISAYLENNITFPWMKHIIEYDVISKRLEIIEVIVSVIVSSIMDWVNKLVILWVLKFNSWPLEKGQEGGKGNHEVVCYNDLRNTGKK